MALNMLWSCGFPTERHSLFLYRSGRICPNMPEPLFPWNSLLVLYIGEAVALNMLRSCGFPTVRLPLFLCRSGRICPNMPEYALEFALNMLRFCGVPTLRKPLKTRLTLNRSRSLGAVLVRFLAVRLRRKFLRAVKRNSDANLWSPTSLYFCMDGCAACSDSP